MSALAQAGTAAPAVSLSARALAHRYGQGRGLEPVSFELAAPGSYAVTGPNGSGKSTLLRIVAGLLRASRGELDLTVDGRVLAPGARREAVGLVSPDLAFYDEFTALENLAFAAEARGLPEPRRLARAALERVELASRADDRVTALSSGMKQRLRLGFAVMHRPALLLLDEPGSHLDEPGRRLVERIVEEHRRQGLVLVATNDEREWRHAGERIELRGRGLGGPA